MRTNRILLLLHIITFSFFLGANVNYADADESKTIIGVLANRGYDKCLERWSSTADYLSATIPGHTFEILPLDFNDIYSSVENGEVNFILANSALYVELENRFRINRIVTMKNKSSDAAYSIFGGVIFCKKDRKDIRNLSDLKNKTFMAAEPTSFGGWQMAWRELKISGIEPLRDFASLSFGGTHDTVVYSVLHGKVDAGTVRTDTLEHMQAEKKIDINDFYIINEIKNEETYFPFKLSTRTYPEWPLAKVKHTSDELAEKVATSLIEMKQDSRAAKDAVIFGWTIPANYQSVHDCLKDLRLPPYQNFGKVTIYDVIKNYWHFISLIATLILLLTGSVFKFIHLNRKIRDANEKLFSEIKDRKSLYEQIKKKNIELEKAISEVKTLSGLLPICSHCKKIRDDKGYWNQIEGYIQEHSGAKFSHGICKECAKKYYPDYDIYED